MHFFYFPFEVIKTVPSSKASILTSHRWMPATLKLSVGKLEGQSESVFDNFFSFLSFHLNREYGGLYSYRFSYGTGKRD